jgi:hypothetical protein
MFQLDTSSASWYGIASPSRERLWSSRLRNSSGVSRARLIIFTALPGLKGRSEERTMRFGRSGFYRTMTIPARHCCAFA